MYIKYLTSSADDERGRPATGQRRSAAARLVETGIALQQTRYGYRGVAAVERAMPLAERAAWETGLARQVLIYPALDNGGHYASREAFQDRFLLTRETIRWFGRHYFGHDQPVLDPCASPARCADLRGLPPAYIVTAALDPLRDEAVSYASALESSGVRVKYRCARGTIHGFLGMARYLAVARDELDHLAAFLRAD